MTINIFSASTHDIVLFFTDKGNVFQLKVHEIPLFSRTARGEIIRSLFSISQEDKITALLNLSNFDDTTQSIFIATKKGVVKKVALSEFKRINQNGKRAITLRDGDSVVDVLLTSGNDEVLLATKKGKALRFNEDKVRVMGRSAGGVRGIRLAEDDALCGVCIINDDTELMMVTESGQGKRVGFDTFKPHGRGTGGQMYYRHNDKRGYVVNVLSVKEDDDIMLITSKGQMIRIVSEQISKQGRAATGIRLVRITPPDFVAAASIVHKIEDEKTE